VVVDVDCYDGFTGGFFMVCRAGGWFFYRRILRRQNFFDGDLKEAHY